jgi:hypothetical protein
MRIVNENGVKVSRTGKVENIPCQFSEWWRNNMHRKAYLTDIDGLMFGYENGVPVPLAVMEVKESDWFMFGTASVEALTALAERLAVPCVFVRIVDSDTVEVAVTRKHLKKADIPAYCKDKAKTMKYKSFKQLVEKNVYNL